MASTNVRDLGDAQAHVAAVEEFYRRIWSEWCRGE